MENESECPESSVLFSFGLFSHLFIPRISCDTSASKVISLNQEIGSKYADKTILRYCTTILLLTEQDLRSVYCLQTMCLSVYKKCFTKKKHD